MTATQLILIIALAIAIITALLAGRRGARITQITRTVKRDDEGDGPDA
jgi:hypothetical protein